MPRTRVGGYLVVTDPSGAVERDTLTCCHCNAVFVVDPPPAPMVGGFCRMCMKATCTSCASKGCTPFLKKVEKLEAKDRLRRAVGV